MKVKIDLPGIDTEEMVPFSSLTKVYGVLQCLKRKHIENISKYTLYNPDSVALDPLRTLSSYNNIPMLYYREKSEDTKISQSKGRVLLKILIVEASGSKLIKFDRTNTVAEAISRILLSYKVENHHIPLYRLFIPLGAPLELSDTLEQLQLQDYDSLEFKKLPPHLLQLIDLKPSPPPVPSRNSVHSNYPVSASPPPDRSSQRENSNTINSHVPVTDWTVNDVTKWLEEIGYGELAPDFVQRSITGESLFSLNKDNLRDQLNIQALGIRKALLREIRKLAVRSQIGAQKELGENNAGRPGPRGPTPSTMQRPTVNSTIRKQLVLAPTLALRDTYEVEERDVVNLSFELVCMLLKKLNDLESWTLEGIFRVSGIKATVERVYFSLRNALPNFNGADAHDVASAFKHYLRSLDDPLIPAAAYAQFISSFSDSDIKQDVLKTAIEGLPYENYKCLKLLVEFCVKIAEHENVNMMGSRNLGIVFGPTVLRNRDPYVDFSNAAAHAQIFKTMVDFCNELFD